MSCLRDLVTKYHAAQTSIVSVADYDVMVWFTCGTTGMADSNCCRRISLSCPRISCRLFRKCRCAAPPRRMCLRQLLKPITNRVSRRVQEAPQGAPHFPSPPGMAIGHIMAQSCGARDRGFLSFTTNKLSCSGPVHAMEE